MGPHVLRPLFKVLMLQSTFQSAAMARGSQDESTAKRKYLQESTHANLTIQESGLLIMESEPCVGASPVGIVTCDCCERRLIEVKCTDGMQCFKSREMMKNSDNHIIARCKCKWVLLKFEAQTSLSIKTSTGTYFFLRILMK
uniref:Putative conserved secreted protein n=1 Tax=Ixodes ricinus TaxID=34613 RepID=A0A6B0UU30_IXORI